MPRLSLYKPEKGNDYYYMDRTISERFQVGGTDAYIHKYLGPVDQGVTNDATQPNRDNILETSIQDLLFLENRDRKYDESIYKGRVIYNVLDIDLTYHSLDCFCRMINFLWSFI